MRVPRTQSAGLPRRDLASTLFEIPGPDELVSGPVPLPPIARGADENEVGEPVGATAGDRNQVVDGWCDPRDREALEAEVAARPAVPFLQSEDPSTRAPVSPSHLSIMVKGCDNKRRLIGGQPVAL